MFSALRGTKGQDEDQWAEDHRNWFGFNHRKIFDNNKNHYQMSWPRGCSREAVDIHPANSRAISGSHSRRIEGSPQSVPQWGNSMILWIRLHRRDTTWHAKERRLNLESEKSDLKAGFSPWWQSHHSRNNEFSHNVCSPSFHRHRSPNFYLNTWSSGTDHISQPSLQLDSAMWLSYRVKVVVSATLGTCP